MLGETLRKYREQSGLSLRRAARQLGVAASYLSRIEAEKVPPSDQLLVKAASAYNCSEDALLLLAGRLSKPLRKLVGSQPFRTAAAIRTMAELCVSEPGMPYGKPLVAESGMRAIEDGFPFEQLSEIAEVESWRKEIYRPIYHVHKWWAQRLGSIFRATILGAASSKGSSIMDLFYEPVRLPGVVVFDPFMGSGTTVGEAQKLGCTAIGRDINPVAYRSVRVALGELDRLKLEKMYASLAAGVGKKIKKLYRSIDSSGNLCDVLYYFWVKCLACPECGDQVDLFSNYVFASHAYRKRNPDSKILCPACGNVLGARYDTTRLTCDCGHKFNPQDGPAKRAKAVCPGCRAEFPIAKTVRESGNPPTHRPYAKLVLRDDDTKEYVRITKADLKAFENASRQLKRSELPLPMVPIQDGFNTRQVINYGYKFWHEMFNDRQLLCLTWLASAIRELPSEPEREALSVLFSGTLEFNNMFASYKGEGTGAVRHMFSHHILKPERLPIEANVWGTRKSSGAFSMLFKSRLLRALDYRHAPFELAVEYTGKRKRGRKIVGVSAPMGAPILSKISRGGLRPGFTYLSCGDSSNTDLSDKSVDLVVTDPPFFDNVHYSELADFFFVWQQLYFNWESCENVNTTRSKAEVQDTEPASFAHKLKMVFSECHRVLKDNGLLVFSYHHSREDGWISVAEAVLGAGLRFVTSQPVKSEMTVAAPKTQAKEPIDLDVLLVCRKKSADHRERIDPRMAIEYAVAVSKGKIERFNRVGRKLSRNDVRVIMTSELLVNLSSGGSTREVLSQLRSQIKAISSEIETAWRDQEISESPALIAPQIGPVQLGLV